MDSLITIMNHPVDRNMPPPPAIVVHNRTEIDQNSSEIAKDSMSIDQRQPSIRSYGAPLGSVDTPPDSVHERFHPVDSQHEPAEDYAPSASLRVHAGKDDESSLSEVDSAAAIRHKPWTSGHVPTTESDGIQTPIHRGSRRLSDAEEKVQAWLKSTEAPDPESNTQENQFPPLQQRRRSTMQALKSHLLHGKLGSGFGKWMTKNDAAYNGAHPTQEGRQELETLGNSNTDTSGLEK